MTVRRLIPGQTYFASVQAVDAGFTGSEFSQEISFTVPGSNDNFLAEIKVSDKAPNQRSLFFGTHSNASNGFDSEHDIATSPPVGFAAHFRLGQHLLIKDVRHTNRSTLTWTLEARVQPGTRSDTRYEWSPSELPAEGSFHIRNASAPESAVDMRTATTFEITRQSPVVLEIIYERGAARTPTYTEAVEHPGAFALRGVYPNPASEAANVTFDLPASAEVRVDLYDLLGRRVLETPWHMESRGAGHDLRLETGSLASGTYLYRLRARSEDGLERVAAGRLVVANLR